MRYQELAVQEIHQVYKTALELNIRIQILRPGKLDMPCTEMQLIKHLNIHIARL